MPYLSLKTADGEAIQLAGNTPAEAKAAIAKHGKILFPDLADEFVDAFFLRRDLTVQLQKATREGRSADAEGLKAKLKAAEKDEQRMRDAYDKGNTNVLASAAEEKEAKSAPVTNKDDPYGFASAKRPVVVEDDDFM
eukprot:GGOE01036480.1.p1 GENE.GGOE01036480.1~~GGOE01036480.1.p1  ORF type:complete len:137 (-),score=49.28 GGOE01036480.1:202-612(-)